MRRNLAMILVLILGILLGQTLAALPTFAWVRETATLILDEWGGLGARPGLYYDKSWAQVAPDKPYEFYECRYLGKYGVQPPSVETPGYRPGR